VVVAVPFEAAPDRSGGHVRTFRPADLAARGALTGGPYRVAEQHGGWLVSDAGQE
jgi:hypothetical protein